MKSFSRILSLVFLVMIVLCSCDMDVKDASGSSSKQPTPKRSSMEVTFGEVALSSDKNEYEYTINVDEDSVSSGYFVFTATHSFDSSVENPVEPGFIFSCEDASIINATKTSCMIDFVSLQQLGSYTVKAKSNAGEEFDRYFVINMTSNLRAITVHYKIQSEYLKEGLEYTDEMKEGTITSLTGDLELCAGAVYDFTVQDKSGNDYTIKGVSISSSSSYVFFREINGAQGDMCCMQLDGKSSTVTFRAGKTDINVKVRIKLKDNSTSYVEEITELSGITDNVLCFQANTEPELDKHYDYQVNISQAGATSPDLLFCIDYYDWNLDVENGYLDNEYYPIPVNPNPTWFTRSSISYIQEGTVRYTVDVDGVLKQFSITPVADTVFASISHGTKNLHTYLYARYKTDPANTYRWRWRIMVGGELEGLDMMIHSTNGEDRRLADNLLEIHPGDEVSWIFRASYVPTTTSNHETLWYISDTNTTKSYTLPSGAVATLPVPASYGSAANRTLYFFDGKEEQKDFGTLQVYYYFLDELSPDGHSDLWTNYGTNGLDCKLVAVNMETGVHNVIDIKNYTQETIIVKGVAQSNTSAAVKIPALANTLKATDKSMDVVITTGYVDDTVYNQAYPNTERGDGFRTFYMPVDSRLLITLESTFDMETVTATGNMFANDSFATNSIYIDEGKRSATIVLSTIYYETDTKTPAVKSQSLTDNAIYTIKVNTYPIYIKVVTYDPA